MRLSASVSMGMTIFETPLQQDPAEARDINIWGRLSSQHVSEHLSFAFLTSGVDIRDGLDTAGEVEDLDTLEVEAVDLACCVLGLTGSTLGLAVTEAVFGFTVIALALVLGLTVTSLVLGLTVIPLEIGATGFAGIVAVFECAEIDATTFSG